MVNNCEQMHPSGQEVGAPSATEAIVGRSAALREVVRQIEMVAQTDATVLVLGETGTGKELVANAVHQHSNRRAAPFVALNCAAVPSTLLESELFGHERGAFTGAHARRTGRFELAHGGTMFLDEIGDMPLAAQPRLLRLLQARTFERLGSSKTLHADVRIIAATNCDLEDMCQKRAFREDLYYRLNVFPIRLPALRERREDIPLLVDHLVSRFAWRLGKDVRSTSDAAMSALQQHDWPGNIRELQNVLERAVILATGPVLEVKWWNTVRVQQAQHSSSLAELNRAHILAVLRSTNGVVGGPNGAAIRLGVKRSTLLHRMRKLGIRSVITRRPGFPFVLDTSKPGRDARGLEASGLKVVA